MVTQDPQTFKSLAKQFSRWKGGLHQNMVIEAKNVRKGNKKMALISHATEIEGTISGLYCYGLPIFTGLCYAFDMGINYTVPLTMIGIDFLTRLAFASVGTYRCNKKLKTQHPELRTIKETITNIVPYCAIEFFNSYQFMKTQMTTAKDAYLKGKKSWDPSWERVKDIGNKK